MPKSKKQKQKKQLKKNRKAKARQKVARSEASSGGLGLIKKANQFPVVECLINSNWYNDDSSLNRIVITRQQPDGLLVFGSFMVDMLLLGLKNAHVKINVPASEIPKMLPYIYSDVDPEDCDLALAHQMIYEAIDYAAKYEFKPHKDFKRAQHVLDSRGTHPETHKLAFGKDGKPFFVAGPYDNAKLIVNKLKRTAGEGNFDYIVPLMEPDDLLMDEGGIIYGDDDEDDDR